MKTHTHTTAAGDVFVRPTIIKTRHRNLNRRRLARPHKRLRIWMLIAISSAIIASLTTYLLTK